MNHFLPLQGALCVTGWVEDIVENYTSYRRILWLEVACVVKKYSICCFLCFAVAMNAHVLRSDIRAAWSYAVNNLPAFISVSQRLQMSGLMDVKVHKYGTVCLFHEPDFKGL